MSTYIEAESDSGNIEYKIAFIDMTVQKIKKYATQLKFRVIEGGGRAIYILGVCDNGKIIGIAKNRLEYTQTIFKKICKEVKCNLEETNEIVVNNDFSLLIFSVKALFSLDNILYICS